ncbi:MAG: substrate-binding domain-containing protein [Candidatus Omnitrophica bacterium]|nr:substrate-binding domain-containing protein [Candidatus Omnitrophota bacterium]
MVNEKKNNSKQATKKTIVLALPSFADMFGSYYAIEIMKGVGKVIEGSEFDLQLHMFDPDTEEDVIRKNLDSFLNLSGVLFADINSNIKIISMIKQTKLPYVIMNNIFLDDQTNCIGIDNKAAAKGAVGYLIKLGHSKVATITGNMKTQSAEMRLEGYKEALAAAKIKENPEYIVNGAYNREKAQEAMAKLINEKPRPTAVFCASDLMAFGAIMMALREDIKVPEDISVVGFDNSPIAALGHVTITTVNQPLSDMGAIATCALIDIINGKRKQPFKQILPTTLIMGSSCSKLV